VVEYAQKGETAGLILEFVSEAPIELTKQDIIFANDKAPIVNKFKALISLPGREHPAFNGYRPQVKFYSVFQTGTMVFEEPDMIMPEDVDILVTVELNEGIMMPIIYGSKLLLYEGGKQVGHIIIVDDRE
jgi:translation elongation factor EF-Tu-like GTPase